MVKQCAGPTTKEVQFDEQALQRMDRRFAQIIHGVVHGKEDESFVPPKPQPHAPLVFTEESGEATYPLADGNVTCVYYNGAADLRVAAWREAGQPGQLTYTEQSYSVHPEFGARVDMFTSLEDRATGEWSVPPLDADDDSKFTQTHFQEAMVILAQLGVFEAE